MQIAVLSDIHGNTQALDAVLEKIQSRKPDLIICLGDVVDPLPGSRRAFKTLTDLHIPILKGNHEDYVIAAFTDPKHEISRLPNWEPVRQVARTFDNDTVKLLWQLPFSFPLTDTVGGEILFVHASIKSNKAGWRRGVTEEFHEELREESARTIVCGHWHHQVTRQWEDKILITVGSVGIPLSGVFEAEYAWLKPVVGGWDVEHLRIPYDHQATLKEYRDSGFALNGGPMAWIVYEELRTAQRTMGAFFDWLKVNPREIDQVASLTLAVKAFLTERGSWDALAREIGI